MDASLQRFRDLVRKEYPLLSDYEFDLRYEQLLQEISLHKQIIFMERATQPDDPTIDVLAREMKDASNSSIIAYCKKVDWPNEKKIELIETIVNLREEMDIWTKGKKILKGYPKYAHHAAEMLAAVEICDKMMTTKELDVFFAADGVSTDVKHDFRFSLRSYPDREMMYRVELYLTVDGSEKYAKSLTNNEKWRRKLQFVETGKKGGGVFIFPRKKSRLLKLLMTLLVDFNFRVTGVKNVDTPYERLACSVCGNKPSASCGGGCGAKYCGEYCADYDWKKNGHRCAP